MIVNARGCEAPMKWVRLDNMYVSVQIYKIIVQTYEKISFLQGRGHLLVVRKSYQVDDGLTRLEPRQMRCNARRTCWYNVLVHF